MFCKQRWTVWSQHSNTGIQPLYCLPNLFHPPVHKLKLAVSFAFSFLILLEWFFSVFMCFCNKLPQIQGHNATQIYYHTVLEVRSPTRVSLGWIPGISQTILVSGVSKGKSISCLFHFSRGCPHSLFCGPLPSFKPAVTGVLFLSQHQADTGFPHLKGPCDCIGATWIIYFQVRWLTTLIPSANLIPPCHVT